MLKIYTFFFHIMKVEHQRIDAFELWCWRRILRAPWTARRSSQSILKEISPEYSLEGMMLKLKLQYFGHLMQRTDSLEKTLMLGKSEAGEGDDRGWDGWMASLTWWTWVWVSSRSWWWTGKPSVLQSMGLQRVGHYWATELRGHHEKCRVRWITSWTQDFWEEYQQPQICRWYHPNGRKRRGTEEPFDEAEKGEWKNRL